MFRCFGSLGAGTLGGSGWDRAAELFASRQGCASEQSTHPRWPGRCSTQGESCALSLGTLGLVCCPGKSVEDGTGPPGCGQRREPERGVTQPCFCAGRGGPSRGSLRLQYSGPVFSTGACMEVRPGSLRPFCKGLYRRRLLGLPSWSILIWLLGNLEKSSLVFFLHFSSFVCVLFSLHDEALISQMNFIQNLIVLGWNADCRGISYRSPQQCGLGTDLLVMREIDWV